MAETIIDTLVTEFGFRTNTSGLRGLERRIDGIRRKLDGLSRGFTILGAGATAALFGVGRGMLGFDQEMNRLQRDTNATAEEFAAMRARVIELGSSSEYTTITLTDAAVALRELAKGGLSVDESMAALPDVLNLVAATEIDVGEAATKTAKLMKGFGLEVEDIPRIHDIIAHAQVTTGATAEQMIDTLLRVAPTARGAGISIEEMGSGLAMLVDQGQLSERAATSLERSIVMLSNVEGLPNKALDSFKALGIDITKVQDLMAQGKIVETFKLLAEAGLDVPTAQNIFGDDGRRAAITLTKSIPELEKFRGSLDDIDGTMKRQAVTMNQGMSGAIAAFTSSLSAAQEALGDAGLRGWIEAAANKLRELVEWFTKAPEPIQQFAAVLLAAGPAMLAIGIGLKAMSFALGALVPVLRAAQIVLAAIGAAGAVITGPVWLAIAGVAGVILVAWKPISTFFVGLWESLSAGSGRIGEAFGRMGAAFSTEADGLRVVFGLIADGWTALTKLFNIDATGEGRGFGAWIIDGLVGIVDAVTWAIEAILAVFNAPARLLEWIGGESADIGAPTSPGDEEPGVFDRIGSFLTADYGPIAPGLASASSGGGGAVAYSVPSYNITVEKIEVNAEGGDPTVIATGIAAKLSEQLHNTAEDFDSSVVR